MNTNDPIEPTPTEPRIPLATQNPALLSTLDTPAALSKMERLRLLIRTHCSPTERRRRLQWSREVVGVPLTDEARTALASLPPFETNFIPAKFRKKSGSGRKPGEICWQLFDTGEPAPFILTGPVLRTAAGEPRPGN